MGSQNPTISSSVVDSIIARLLAVKKSRPGKQVKITESEIRDLCNISRNIFLRQPNLLELEAPIKICGKSCRITAVSFFLTFRSFLLTLFFVQETFMGNTLIF